VKLSGKAIAIADFHMRLQEMPRRGIRRAIGFRRPHVRCVQSGCFDH
jgi:hypothetical protein